MFCYHLLLVGLVCVFNVQATSLTCVRSGPCRCVMSDGSGAINLNRLSFKGDPVRPMFTVHPFATRWAFSYSPCRGFDTSQFSDLAALQKNVNGTEFDLGVQSKEVFTIDSQGNVKVTYTSADGLRSSGVLLNCEPSMRINQQHFQYIGELITREHEFSLFSPCACPGACDGNKTTTTTLAPATPLISTTTIKQNTPPGGRVDNLYWPQVGADIVSLVLHDLMLIVAISIVLLVFKFVFGYTLACCYRQKTEVPYTNA